MQKNGFPLKRLVVLLALGFLPVFGFQSDLIFPWVTQNDLFQGVIVLNNLQPNEATVNLIATRQAGSTPATRMAGPLTIAPHGQRKFEAGALFPDLTGAGGGYMVRVTSEQTGVVGAFLILGGTSSARRSPSQANVCKPENAAPIIAFAFLESSPRVFSAPVVINMGDATATIRFHAYQDRVEAATAERMVPALHPHAELTADLFPDLEGSLMVVAESEAPLLGAAFIFNDLLEPSMANAVPLDVLPDPGMRVSFSGQIQPIFDASCGSTQVVCHQGGNGQAMLILDPEVAYGNIVRVPARESFFNRIEPGDPWRSYLYLKLLPFSEGQYDGLRMPVGRDKLDAETLALVRGWILQGAPNN